MTPPPRPATACRHCARCCSRGGFRGLCSDQLRKPQGRGAVRQPRAPCAHRKSLGRQIRIEGTISSSRRRGRRYFASRRATARSAPGPRSVAALPTAASLEDRFADATRQYAEGSACRGGQGPASACSRIASSFGRERPFRLHDRVLLPARAMRGASSACSRDPGAQRRRLDLPATVDRIDRCA
jgi:hypothetical protein